jgi:beta-aspartyl-dipeptidase (metallo-type)
MLTLLKNADIYAPEHLGTGHVLLGGGKILYVGDAIPDIDSALLAGNLDLQGAKMIPGLIDAHVHCTGGGGEGGFATQVPAPTLSNFTLAGVTTVVGLLGTDDETRTMSNLLARTRALREEGLSAWCWTGGYHIPVKTLTGSVRSDIVNIECIIGLGELAISDHRSSQPGFDELARLASEAYIAGMLSRKAGILHLHLGDGPRGLELVRRLLDETELPAGMIHPTHVNRRRVLFEEACELSLRGVTIDVTAAPVEDADGEWSAEDAWENYHQQLCPPENLTMSSDSGGCLPVFDDKGRLQSMDVAPCSTLIEALRTLVGRGHDLEKVLPCMTSNVARLLRFDAKGRIAAGMDADLVSLDSEQKVQNVFARGRLMVRDGAALVTGTFEG